MQKASVRKNYIYSVLYQILTMIVPLISTPYVSRVLLADGIGNYSYALAVNTYFALFTTFGTSLYGQIQVAAVREDKRKVSAIIYELFVLRIFLLLLVLMIYIFFVINQPQKQINMLYWILIINIFSQFFDITWILQGFEMFQKTVLKNVAVKLGSIGAIFLFVKSGSDLWKYALILQLSVLLGNISLFPYLKGLLEPVPLSEWRIIRHIKKAVPYVVPSITATIFTSTDKTMIGLLTNSSYENGVYEQSTKIYHLCSGVVNSFSTVLLPRLTYLYHSGTGEKEFKNMLEKSLQYAMLISMPIVFGLIAVSDNLVACFLGPGYDKAAVLVKILSFVVLFSGLNNFVGHQCLMAREKQNDYNKCIIAGALVNVLLNAVLIPGCYSVGAAAATVCSEALILCLFIHFSGSLIYIKDCIRIGRRYFLLSVIMGLGVLWLGRYLSGTVGLVVEVGAGILIYMVSLIVIRDPLIMGLVNGIRQKKR